MINTITHKVGQSIYDLCLQAYGTLDLLIKFCVDNNVTDLSNIPQQLAYKYDTALVKANNVLSTGATIYVEQAAGLITEDGTQYLITEDSTNYLIA